MIITFSKDGAPSRHVPSALCLSFWRAFRAELWRLFPLHLHSR